jgi:hypothetical protein
MILYDMVLPCQAGCDTILSTMPAELICRDCGQPMLPAGVVKKPNEYDHASGCPQDAYRFIQWMRKKAPRTLETWERLWQNRGSDE